MDIDSDFCIEKGPLVFKYLNDKYGKENCCNIITFSRLTTKMVIKDVSKALDIPFKEVNAFTAILPSGPNDDITIDEILNDPKYNKLDFVKKHPRVFKFASKIVGCVRHAGQHAAGIAVTPMPVHEIAPVYYGREVDMPDGTVFKGNRSQFTKEECESVGIIKLDILKLKNVTELDKECKEIQRIYGAIDPKYKNFTLDSIPLDDKETWKIFGDFNTKGVFQFASPVSKPVLMKIKPENMEELAAATSLIRPGTAGLDDYVNGKYKKTIMKKIDARLSKWLESTYGAIVFQEKKRSRKEVIL